MVLNLILLSVSFVFLYYGAKWLVVGASIIANRLNISKVVVGTTLVAFGTSTPELFVNTIAAYHGHNGIALSNISGSNLANLCLGYGLCACFGKLIIDKKKFGLDLVYFCSAPLLVLFFLVVFPGSKIPLWGAGVLIIPLILYIRSMKNRLYDSSEQTGRSRDSLYKGLLIFLTGVIVLYLSGELIVRSALQIGECFGVSETIMGLTVVAVGTSLPDLTASLVAVKRGEASIAVGNLLGSNIFNILLVLSSSLIASRRALIANNAVITDYSMVFIASVLFVLTVLKREKVGRVRGGILIAVYFAYIASRVLFFN